MSEASTMVRCPVCNGYPHLDGKCDRALREPSQENLPTPAVPGAQAQNVTAPAPASFVRFDNDMVMAFDRTGHQVLDCQGPYSKVATKIRALASAPDVEFYRAKWRGKSRKVSSEEFHAAEEVQS